MHYTLVLTWFGKDTKRSEIDSINRQNKMTDAPKSILFVSDATMDNKR